MSRFSRYLTKVPRHFVPPKKVIMCGYFKCMFIIQRGDGFMCIALESYKSTMLSRTLRFSFVEVNPS